MKPGFMVSSIIIAARRWVGVAAAAGIPFLWGFSAVGRIGLLGKLSRPRLEMCVPAVLGT